MSKFDDAKFKVPLGRLQQYADLVLLDGDLEREDGLETPDLISLMSDQRVGKKESYDGTTRGFWAESLLGYNLGSKLWLLDRARIDKKTLRLTEQYAIEALQWRVDEGTYDRVEAVAIKDPERTMGIILTIRAYRPNNALRTARFMLNWNNQIGA